MVGHGTQRIRVNGRATSEDIRRRIEISRSNGAGEFRCPTFVQTLTHGKAVFRARTKDTRCVFNGIAGVWFKTAGSVKVVWDLPPVLAIRTGAGTTT